MAKMSNMELKLDDARSKSGEKRVSGKSDIPCNATPNTFFVNCTTKSISNINHDYAIEKISNAQGKIFADIVTQGFKTKPTVTDNVNNNTTPEGSIGNDDGEIFEVVKSLLEKVLEDPSVVEREEGELDESGSELELETATISNNLKSNTLASATAVKNSSSIEAKECFSSTSNQKIQKKVPCFQKNPQYGRVTEKQKGELVAHSHSSGNGGELEIRIFKELKEDMQALNAKCSEVKSKINTANERILYRHISELKIVLSCCLESLERKNYSTRNTYDTAKHTTSDYFKRSFENKKIADKNRCESSKKENRRTDRYEREYKRHRIPCREINKCTYKARHDVNSISIHTNTRSVRGSNVSSSNSTRKTSRTNNERCSSKLNAEKKKASSLISRQVDIINKHVSNADFCRKSVIQFRNGSQDTKSEDENQEFNREIKTLEDMESFLSFLKQRKRKILAKNSSPCKKNKMSNYADSSAMNKRTESLKCITSGNQHKLIEKISGKRKKMEIKSINYFSTKPPQTNILQEQSQRQISDKDIDKSNEVRNNMESNFEKFTGEIKTLEDMEAFLSFLRKRKALNEGTNFKTPKSAVEVENGDIEKNLCDAPGKSNRENSSQNLNETIREKRLKFDPHSGLIHSDPIEITPNFQDQNLINLPLSLNRENSKDTMNTIKTVYKTPSVSLNKSKPPTVKDDEIRKKSGKLILKPFSLKSKPKISNSGIFSKQTDKIPNGSNRENEEISSKEIESSPMRQLNAGKSEEISAVHSNHDVRVDRFLKLTRERRKAKLMACVAMKPEKISKILRDLKEKKLELIGDESSRKEYQKVLQKIRSETKIISMA